MVRELPENRRDRRIAARRTQILEAAARLFAEKGFHRTTTRDIAEAADIAEGTLYNYFDNKEELLMGIMAYLVAELQIHNHLESGLANDPRQFFLSMLHYRKDFVEEHQPMLQSVLSEILVNPELRDRYFQDFVRPQMEVLQQHLQARIDLDQVRSVNPAMVVRIIMGLTTGLFFLDALGDVSIDDDWPELANAIVGLFFDGLSPGNHSGPVVD